MRDGRRRYAEVETDVFIVEAGAGPMGMLMVASGHLLGARLLGAAAVLLTVVEVLVGVLAR